MTITIKKISNYALFGTIISASATAPAQASLTTNINSNDDLNQNPQNQASSDSKDILVKTPKCNEANCISFPNFDLYGEFDKNNDPKTLNNSLLKIAKGIIKDIETAEAVKVKTSQEGVVHIIYDAEFTPSQSKQQSALNTYTNVWQSKASQKKKVPEPSALLGLIALGLFAAKRKAAKNIQKSLA
ncbi:MAG: PEP-CTERM sorting domain-containing protein [Rivularia sp. (in: cyanobacteria)]